MSDCRLWYAIQVKLKYEAQVAERLRLLEQEVFAPVVATSNGALKPGTTNVQALFPGYIFCRMQWASGPRLYLLRHFIRVVGTSNQPTPIEDEVIDAIQALVHANTRIDARQRWTLGTLAEIAGGPFAGRSGCITRIAGDRVHISLPLLHQSVVLQVSTDQLVLREGQ